MFPRKNKFKRHVKSLMMMMLTKWMCALKVTFSMKVGFTETKEEYSEDTSGVKRTKTSF